MNNNIIDKMQNLLYDENLDKVETILCSYLLDNLDNIKYLSAMEVAQNCYTSTTSLNRLMKKIGFTGYRDFKFYFQNYTSHDYDFEKLFVNIHSASQFIDHKSLDQFINYLNSLDKFYIIAAGASNTSAIYLHRLLLVLNYPVIYLDDLHLIKLLHNQNILVISSSGDSHLIKECLTINIKNNNNIFAITSQNSFVDKQSVVSYCHKLSLNRLSVLEKEQQLHLILMINLLIEKLN